MCNNTSIYKYEFMRKLKLVKMRKCEKKMIGGTMTNNEITKMIQENQKKFEIAQQTSVALTNEEMKKRIKYLENENLILRNLIQFRISNDEIENLKNDEEFKKNHQSLYTKFFEEENETNTPIYTLARNVKNEVQSNLLTTAIYNCTPTERKIIAYCIAQVNNKSVIKYDANHKQNNDLSKIESISMGIIKFKISDFLKTMELKITNTEFIKTAIDTITDCKIRLEDEFGNLINFAWFSYSVYNKKEKCCYVKFNDILYNHLLNQKSNFSKLKLKIIGQAKSVYTMRFYEIGVMHRGFKGKNGNKSSEWFFEMTEEEIREKFNIDNELYKDRIDRFNKIVIQDPIEELNKINDEFRTTVRKIVNGRKIEKYRFECIELKPTRAKTSKEKAEAKALKIIEEGEKARNTITLTEEQKQAKAEKEFLKNYFDTHSAEIEILKASTPKLTLESENLYHLRLADILAKIKNEKPSFK